MDEEKCFGCQYCTKINRCVLMLDKNISNIDICIMDIVREKKWETKTLETFVLQNNPKLFLSYLSFLRKDKLPKVGDKVVTLRAGFGSFDSRILYVSGITDKHIELEDFIIDETEIDDDEYNELWDECEYYLSDINLWYKDLFVFDENN